MLKNLADGEANWPHLLNQMIFNSRNISIGTQIKYVMQLKPWSAPMTIEYRASSCSQILEKNGVAWVTG